MVSDVTEFNVAGQKVYLSPLIDLFSGEVVNHSISTSPNLSFVMAMFEGLDDVIPKRPDVVIHTDQGLPYWHWKYKARLTELGSRQSMSKKGNCLDNAPAESFFGHLKSEFFYRRGFSDVKTFIKELNHYVDWYNNERIRCDLGGLSPVEYRLKYSET